MRSYVPRLRHVGLRLTLPTFIFAVLAFSAAPSTAFAQDLNGNQLLAVSRVAMGGQEIAGLQNVTVKAEGFVNMAPFAAAGLGTGAPTAAVEVQLKITDYQDKQMRRRLDIAPTGMMPGPTFLVFTGTEGGGQFAGTPFRVSEIVMSLHWSLMGFGTLNRAIDGNLEAKRQKDEMVNGVNHWAIEVKYTPIDTVRYYINPQTFLIGRVTTRRNSQVIIDETRTDYRKVGCMQLPFHVTTKLNGNRLADLNIASYDVTTVVPTAKFTLTATP